MCLETPVLLPQGLVQHAALNIWVSRAVDAAIEDHELPRRPLSTVDSPAEMTATESRQDEMHAWSTITLV